MTDEQKNTGTAEQAPPARIGEDLDIDFWTLLEESRIIQAGKKVSSGSCLRRTFYIYRSKVSLSVSHDNLTFDKLIRHAPKGTYINPY